MSSEKNLPNDTAVLILGICSLVMCGLGLVLGILALVLSSKSLKEHKENPELFSESSYSNLKAGRTCGIIGICFSSMFVLFYIVYFGFVLSMMGGAIMTGSQF